VITATLATTPDRLVHALGVVEDLRPQVDRIRVYVNGPIPGNLPADVTWWSAPAGDLADAGKLYDPPTTGYALLVDDDLHYPEDYVRTMLAGLARYDGDAVTLHGCRVAPPLGSYYRDRRVVARCLYDAPRDELVQIPGTGVFAYDARSFYPPCDPVRWRFMTDIGVGRAAAEQRTRIVALAHGAGFIRHRDIDHSTTIWTRFHRNDGVQTAAVNEFAW
jgi:hypothetical protein